VVSLAARVGTAVSVALMALAVARWGPVHAEPPLDVRALPLAPWALAFAVVAALTGRPRSSPRWRRAAVGLGVVVAALAVVVAARGPEGLSATVLDDGVVVGQTTAGPIDVVGRDVPGGPIRHLGLEWEGALAVPRSGAYSLWVEGRGRVRVRIGGWPLLEASGAAFEKETEIALAEGSEPLAVDYAFRGRGPRLRLGWTRPDGRREVIPPRYLGAGDDRATWALIDALALAAAVLVGFLVFLAPWDAARRLPVPRPVTRGEAVLVTSGYVLLVAVMSWPLVRDLAHTGPLYRPDGRLNAWILAWAGHALWTEPTRVFQAPSFYPLPDTLAFSENLLLPGLLAAPAGALGGPILAYNLVLLVSLVLSGLGTYLLVRRAGGDRLGAFVGGAVFAAGPHRWTRLPHIQAQVTVFLPLALLALDRFWERRTLRRALLVGLLVALQGLSSVYLGAITAAAVALAVAVGLFGGLRARDLLRLSAGFLLAAAILWPAAEPYFRMRDFEGQEFPLAAVSAAAADLPSYAAGGTRLWGAVSRRQIEPGQAKDALFPGLLVLLLGVAGLASAPRRYRAVGIAVAVGGVVLSLGPETAFYRWLHQNVILVRSVRVLTRFALLPTLVLSVLAGLALTGRRRRWVLLALVLMMAESSNLPLRLSYDAGPSPAARWLAGGEGPIAYVPVGEDDTQALLDGVVHFRPMVNGGAAFIPRPYDRALDMLGGGTLGEEALRFLRAVDVGEVVSRVRQDLPAAASFGEETVYTVPPGPVAEVVEAGEPRATLWTPGAAIVDLGEVRPVRAIVFPVGDAPWPQRPSLAVSLDGKEWETIEATASVADATLSLYRSPREGRGAVRFALCEVRFVRIGRSLPLREGALESRP
jgi:hypothetical protein